LLDEIGNLFFWCDHRYLQVEILTQLNDSAQDHLPSERHRSLE
jgi:hypothetical protein